jgi:hypothetical protein
MAKTKNLEAKQSPPGALRFDEDAQMTVERAIHPLYRIRRLAIRAVDDLPDGDVESFCMAITEISQLHGKALDDCATRLSGHPGVGCFDKGAEDMERRVSHG